MNNNYSRKNALTNNSTLKKIIELEKRIKSPKAAVIDKQNIYEIHIEIPNVDEVTVELINQQIVLISGKRNEMMLDQEDRLIYREFDVGEFKRRVKLPGVVNTEFDIPKPVNGVLTLQFRKEKTNVVEKTVKVN